MKLYPDWYKIPAVKFEMIKFLNNREVAFLKPSFSTTKGMSTRMLRIHNVQSLDAWNKNLHVWEGKKDYNMYHSIAKFKNGIPFSSFNLTDRDFGNWNRDCWQEIEEYDFFLDIDSGNHKELEFSCYSAKVIKQLFDNLDVPYLLRFSGMGFHFIIPYRFFNYKNFNPHDDDNIYNIFMDIAIKLHNKFSEMIDLNIYDYRRVVKIPYSLALYKDKSFVCLPLNSDEEFENFNLKNMMPSNWISKVRGRGEKLFNEKGNVNKLMNQLKIKW